MESLGPGELKHGITQTFFFISFLVKLKYGITPLNGLPPAMPGTHYLQTREGRHGRGERLTAMHGY